MVNHRQSKEDPQEDPFEPLFSCMYYDLFKQGFGYYSNDSVVSYKILNAMAMKYVIVFFCRDFFMDEFVLNEKEIKTFLISRGFRIIKPQNYSLLDQVKIFSNAKIIVGLYGAAMMMISFCKKNTKIIEIKPSKGGNEFKNISIILKLRHRQINLKPKFKTTTPQNGLLVCPIERIEKEIQS